MKMKYRINMYVKRNPFLSWIKLVWFKKKWRKINTHNFTTATNCFNINCVSVGSMTYGRLYIKHFGNQDERILIGNYCCLADEITFLLGGEHMLNNISTYPFKVKLGYLENESITRGTILIDDDVWIGYRATILSGIHIGQGAVVAAGSVVTKDIPPYAVVGGVPAKIIKYRFTSDVIDYLLTLDYGRLTNEMIHEHIDKFYNEIAGMSLDEVKKALFWFPKK